MSFRERIEVNGEPIEKEFIGDDLLYNIEDLKF